MRIWLACCLSIWCGSLAHAQDQEQKLVDRLLKPNTTLQSSAQNKKFTADGASIDKRAAVGTFYVQEKPTAKPFSQPRSFSSSSFKSESFHPANAKSRFSSQSVSSGPAFATSTSNVARTIRDGNKAARTRDFSNSRPFLDKGKSQKSLERKNPPMTIEQVRELLNKNK